MASDQLEMDEKTHEAISSLCDAGDALGEEGKLREAIGEYLKAWRLIPEPKIDWEASTWVLGAIGDSYFRLDDMNEAGRALQDALRCPGGLGNPFLHMRFGQVLFELGDLDAAADQLMRAYMGGDREIFEQEEPKYLAFLGTRAKL